MDLIISNSSSLPIYQQIVEQVKNLIISGDLKEGDALPSMRILASSIRVSVITTKRAYEELEKEGYIYSVTGKGSFVAGTNAQLIKEEQLKKIESLMVKSVEIAGSVGISLEELTAMLDVIYNQD